MSAKQTENMERVIKRRQEEKKHLEDTVKMLQARLAESDIRLELADDALAFLVDVCYDPIYGARPLKRAIQNYVENPLAQALLGGRYKGGDRVVMHREDNKLVCGV